MSDTPRMKTYAALCTEAVEKIAKLEARAESLQADYLGMCQVVRDRDATIESLQSQLAAAQADAKRWHTFCGLWAASTELKVYQEETGFWAIAQIEPAEDITFKPVFGATPDDAIDAAKTGEQHG